MQSERGFSINALTSSTPQASEDSLGRRRSPVAQLIRALARQSGHIVLHANDVRAATALLQLVTPSVDAYRAATIRVTRDGLHEIISAILTGNGEAGTASPAVDPPADLRQLVTDARAAGKPILVVVEDAEKATIDQLERLRVTLECAPDAIAVVRILLIGGAGLEAKLADRTAQGLASRIVARVEVPSIAGDEGPTVATPTPARSRTMFLYATPLAAVLLGLTGFGLLNDRFPSSSDHVPQLELTRVARAPRPVVAASPVAVRSPRAEISSQPSVAMVTTPPVQPTRAPTAVRSTLPPQVVARATPAPQQPDAERRAEVNSSAIPVQVALQVGSFRNRRNALVLRERLAGHFPEVYVIDVSVAGITYHRVRIGRFADHVAVAIAETALRENGYDPITVRPRSGEHQANAGSTRAH